MGWFAPQKAERVLRTALAEGVRHFDTAGFYCDGVAEPRLGEILGRAMDEGIIDRQSLVLSTKVGKQIGKRGRLIRDFRPETVKADLARSRARLGVDTLDIVYLHGPNEHELASSLPALLDEKGEGRVIDIGVCTDAAPLMRAATHPEVDAIMGRLNLFNTANRPAFQAAKAAGKKVVAISPLGQALWRKDLWRPTTLSQAWYLARAVAHNPHEMAQARHAKWIHQVDGWSPTALAVAFLRLEESVDTILTTTTNPQHIQQTAHAFAQPLTADIRARFAAPAP